MIQKGGVNMTGYVFCIKDPNHYDKINFYLEFDRKTYYLFTQHYSNTAYDRFKNKKRLDEALKHQDGIQLRSFNEKLPKFIKYIEDTEDIIILRKTIKKTEKKNRKKSSGREAA